MHNHSSPPATLWRIYEALRGEDACGTSLDAVSHLAWLLLLRCTDQRDRGYWPTLVGPTVPVLIGTPAFRWSAWVSRVLGKRRVRRGARGASEWSPDQARQFIRGQLLPHLASFSGTAERSVLADFFSSRLSDVYVSTSDGTLFEALSLCDTLDMMDAQSLSKVAQAYTLLLQEIRHETSTFGGVIPPPQAAARLAVEVLSPRIGERIYDPACGQSHFLLEAFNWLDSQRQTEEDAHFLARYALTGREKKAQHALLGLTHLLLNGVAFPQITSSNALAENVSTPPAERFDIILSNPLAGETVEELYRHSVHIQTRASELLYLEHSMSKLELRRGSRCCLIVPGSVFFRRGAHALVREELLHAFNVFLVVHLPPGAFSPTSSAAMSLLFFEFPGPSREILSVDVPLPAGKKRLSPRFPLLPSHLNPVREVWGRWKDYREGRTPRPCLPAFARVETVGQAGEPHPSPVPDALPSPAELISEMMERSQRFREVVGRLTQQTSGLVEDAERYGKTIERIAALLPSDEAQQACQPRTSGSEPEADTP